MNTFACQRRYEIKEHLFGQTFWIKILEMVNMFFHLITQGPFLHDCSLKARQILQLCRHSSHSVHRIMI